MRSLAHPLTFENVNYSINFYLYYPRGGDSLKESFRMGGGKYFTRHSREKMFVLYAIAKKQKQGVFMAL
jgi:hypothetical protein